MTVVTGTSGIRLKSNFAFGPPPASILRSSATSSVAGTPVAPPLDMSNNSIQLGDLRALGAGSRRPHVADLPGLPHLHNRVFLRSLGVESGRLRLEHLGMAAGTRAILTDALARPQGVVLAAGPPGSGRTTTIYAAVEHIRSCRAIMPTPEELAGDLFVPEIRDTATADLVMRTAHAGCLVVSTMHAHDASQVIRHLISLCVPRDFLVAKLQAIVAQRLVRMVCVSCREEVAVRNALLDSSLPLSEWRGSGCERCGRSGYRGLTGIFEVLVMDDSLRGELAPDAAGDPRQLTHSLTGASLYEDGLRQVRAGVTTVEEVLRVTTRHRRDVAK